MRLLIAFGLISILVIVGWLLTRPENNYNSVADSSIGLTFNISKKFEVIPRSELTALNPGFLYGYRPPGDSRASCIISQSSLARGGTTSTSDLRDGLLKEVKKLHPDVKLTNENSALNLVKFGEAKGVLLEMEYGKKEQKINRVEIIALGKKIQVIAYCESLGQDNARYYQNFTTLFSSLKLND